ncbi:MAG: ATP-binding protein [Actinobacteria bacterium]|nr:ATP-binding protein [Actinomycetota bacterium]
MEIKEIKDIRKFLPGVNVSRDILPDIINWIAEKEIIVLLGARQVGKTTIIFQLINHILVQTASLLKEKDEIHYLNLDFPEDKKILNDDYIIKLAAKNKKRKIIFIDEMQRLENSGLFLKYLYDLNLPIKLIVSGSSVLELKSKVSEALTGRKVIFNIAPFNISEIIDSIVSMKKNNIPDNDFSNKDGSKSNQETLFKKAFETYTQYGSYPLVVISSDNEKRHLRLKEIFTSYMEKDIKKFLEIKNENAFTRLITLLSASSGSLINMDEISNTLSIHQVTLDNYFYYLEQTFIIDKVRPFFKNIRKEIVKSPKVYFNDIGIRNFAINNFNNLDIREDKGFVFENFVYLILKQKLTGSYKINFWRTKAGAEVDFIILKNLKPIPIEAKAKYFKKPAITQSMRSFINTYKPKIAFVINLNLDNEIKINGCMVKFISTRSFVEGFDLASEVK